ncbi:MAG: MBL fold metallo-hydrolase [Candidatus Aenigmatarchaeota archaeon]
MVSLTFYGGVHEIGGNKILLSDGDTKVFLDFGMSFGQRGKYFEEFMTPRTANGIGDFLAMGLLPDIKGVYREDLLKHAGRPPEDVDIDGVLLSHGHADHTNYISFLHSDIPIHCSDTTHKLLIAIEEQSNRSIENEVLNFKKRPLFRCDYKKPATERTFKTFNGKFKIGSLEIEPCPVDHSVPGANAFIIHTSAGPIVYTGDLRLHGTKGDMTREFVRKATEAKPIAMVCEGTRIKEMNDKTTENDVYTKGKALLDRPGMSIVDFNFKDVDRFRTVYRIAQELGKKLVISFKHACYLDQYARCGLDVPGSDGEGILIFQNKVGTGTYDPADYVDEYVKCRLDQGNVVRAGDIKEDCLVVLNFWYFNTLVDLRPKAKSVYMHSLSEPFNEEMEISYARMRNWLSHFGMDFVQNHCSGHATGADIMEIVKSVNPKTLFPIHTEYPGVFRKFGVKNKVVKYGIEYDI